MDYARVYREFIADRRLRENEAEGCDKHHIIPRSLGGSNDSENIIRLTPEEHIFAHALLAKIHGGHLVTVVARMSGMARYIGRRSRLKYGQFRRAHRERARLAALASWADPQTREARIAANRRPETREARSRGGKKRWDDPAKREAHAEHMRAKWADPEASKNLRAANSGNGFTAETSRALWADPKFRKKRARSMKRPETKKKLAVTMNRLHADPEFHAAALERLSSPEVRAKRSNAMRVRWAARKAAGHTSL